MHPKKLQGAFSKHSSWAGVASAASGHPSSHSRSPTHCVAQIAWQSNAVVHAPAEHTSPLGQDPHEPPQPLSPHTLPEQLGVHAPQVPLALHDCPTGQLPHVPPHPSAPQDLPAHCGTQGASQWVRLVHTSQTFAQQSPDDLHELSQ
jgi:hypothetical protein